MIVNNFIGHLKTVLTHKYYVFQASCKLGIPLRGALHDLSKFSPTEFFESVKYYSGTRSPIEACKEDKGYSMTWFHHRGRNKHHWEYWVDNFEKGMTPTQIPYKYSIEMLCDFIGAGKAYEKEKWSFHSLLMWWLNKRTKVVMHPVNWYFINSCLSLMEKENKFLTKKQTKEIYEYWSDKFRKGEIHGVYNSKIKY